jgi:CheY-like chemotaxis protein
MGGDVTVTSAPGQGSTFTVRLPAETEDHEAFAASATAASEPQQPGVPGSDRRDLVLVIDDSRTARELIAEQLARQGFRTLAAASGKDGLRLARELHPAVITLDVMMPEMDGWTVIAALKGDPDLARIPVIIVSIVDDARRGIALGAADYLTKPIDRERLVAALAPYRPERGASVLLVEDDDDQRRAMRGVLVSQGWTVTEAANGRLALDALASQGVPDIVLLDLMMPEMDGFEAVAALQAHQAWSRIPVVVVTALDLSAEDRRRLTRGVEYIAAKSANDPAALMQRLGTLMADIRSRSPVKEGA